jgi:hypothetical protein
MNATAPKEDTFVPFGPATLNATTAKAERDPSLKLIPGGGAENTFSPLLTAGGSPGGSSKEHNPASFTLQKDGERITGIRVECACGQVVELACSYTLIA